MTDMLSTGVSGLLAFQRALDTTSHNISNVTTDGYSRQRVELVTRQAQGYGSGWIGNGTDVSTVRRLYDDFVGYQVRSSSSSFQQLDTFTNQTTRVANLLGNSTTGLTASLQSFINAIQDVANTPASVPARQALISQAQALSDRLSSYDTNLKMLDTQVTSQVDGEATTITQLASGIAGLNKQIVNETAQFGQPPNDLLDKRDHLLDQLATHVSINTTQQDDGQVNVFIGSGQTLVVGGDASRLVATQDTFDPTRKNLSLVMATGSVDVTKQISGGTLGGMLDFRRQVLDPARDSLGKLTVVLADVVNTQHHNGIDLNGNLGGNFFTTGGVQTLPNSANTGTAALAITRSSVASLTGANYVLTSTAGGWVMQRADTGAAVPLAGAGTLASPFTADGLSIVVSGAPVLGDRFLIQPTRAAIGGLQVLVDDPAEVAAAAPIVAAANTANTGTGKISPGEVLDSTNPQLRTATTIQFLTANTYSVNGAGSFAYTGGGNIDINGWRVQISGSPAVGDRFSVTDNTNGVGDNRNALKLTDALNKPVLNGGTTSLNAAAGQLISGIGVAANQAQSGRDAQQVIYNDNVSAQQTVSGVNLDEEAANLVRYQQAYQAAAQVIKVADTLFQAVIAAVRG